MRETGRSGSKDVEVASSEIRRVVISALGRLEVNVTLLVAVVVVAIAAASGMEGLEGRNEENATPCNARRQLQPAPD
jgi:hypothetical protein